MLPAGATVGAMDIAAVAASLPAEHRESVRERLGRCQGRRILRLPAGAVVPGDLHLDPEVPTLGQPGLCAVLAEGDLTVEGDVLNLDWNDGRALVVLGRLRAANVVKAGASLLVTGDLECRGVVLGVYNDGSAWVSGGLRAEAFITLDHDFGVGGPVEALRIDDGDGHAFLVPEVFHTGEDGERELDWDALVSRATGHQPLVRADYGSDVDLWAAAQDPNPQLLKRVLERRPDVNAPDAQGAPALVLAARSGTAAHVRLLLAAGASAGAKDAEGRTALHEAAREREPAMLELLLAARAPVDAVDGEGWTPLARACWADRPENVRRLLKAGADPRRPDGEGLSLLGRAAEERAPEVIGLLLKAGHPADAAGPRGEGRTPLHRAVAQDHAATIEALLAGGASLEASSADGETPLLTAAREGRLEATRLLLARGASVTARDRQGRGALALALLMPDELRTTAGKLEALGIDVDPGLRADLEEHEAERRSPAFRVGWEGPSRVELALALVDAGADPHGRGAGLPALMMSPSPEVAARLLRAGALVDGRDDFGYTPLLGALENTRGEQRRALVRLFLEHGADPGVRTPDGRSAGQLAAESGDGEVHAAVLAALKRRGQVGRLEELRLRLTGLRAGLAARLGGALSGWLLERGR